MSNVQKWEASEQWVTVNLDLCTGIGACQSVCPVEVYQVSNGKVSANNIGECIACGACQDVCPHHAIIGHWAY
ncbi:MAG: 4Fe-4S binding protein [Candidatus Bathyarchaeota archaeon]|nr:MAG: 4Fe-4S binding protein [Candidatus Bathyarchaeota archaeon]